MSLVHREILKGCQPANRGIALTLRLNLPSIWLLTTPRNFEI
jgi:hypothetical protein